MAWLSGWARRTPVKISGDDISSNQSHFPVGIQLTDDQAFIFEHLASDANRFKIAVTLPDGTTEAYIDIECWDTENTTAKIYFGESTRDIRTYSEYYYLYYDNAHADNTTHVCDAGGTVAQSVYNANFALICHMANSPAGDAADAIKDSTSNDNDMTPAGTMTADDLVDYNYDKAIDFDGSDDCLHFGPIAAFPTTATLEIDFCLDTLAECTLISLGKTTDSRFTVEVDIYDDTAGGGSWQVRYRYSSDGTTVNTAVKDISLIAGIKTSLTMRRYGTTLYIAQDGVALGTVTLANNYALYTNSTDEVYVGSRNGDSNFIDGQIAEIWLSVIKQADSYVKAAYHSRLGDLTEFDSFCIEEVAAGTLTMAEAFESVNSMTATPVLYSHILTLAEAFTPVNAMTATPAMVTVTERDQRIFTFSLSAPGYAEITIPVSSFSTRIRSGEPTYLQVVIPGDDYADEITERTTDGVMVLRIGYKQAGEVVLTEPVAIVDLEDITLEEGATKKTITLTGHRTETFSTKTVALTGASYQKTTNGALRVRCTPNRYLRPGDTAQVNGEEFTVDSISWSVSVAVQKIRETYEIAEAA